MKNLNLYKQLKHFALLPFFRKLTSISLAFLLVFWLFPISVFAKDVSSEAKEPQNQRENELAVAQQNEVDLGTSVSSSKPVVSNIKASNLDTENDTQDLNLKDKNKIESQQRSSNTSGLVPGTDQPDNVNGKDYKANQAKVDNLSGALIYDYPINVPLGRNGLQPDIKLTYNNQNNNLIGSLGYGWSLNIPNIERKNIDGVNNIFQENNFTSFLSDDLVSTGGGNFMAKVEKGDFLNYHFESNVWTVTNKVGLIYKFGSSTESRLSDPVNPSIIYSWYLDEIRDSNQNYIKYVYQKDQGQIYPWKIIYSGNGSTDGIMEIDFILESRADVFDNFKTGFEVVSAKRISSVQVLINGIWVRQYQISYISGDNGVRSLIGSITETGRSETGQITQLPPTVFEYQTNIPEWSEDRSYISPTTDNYILGRFRLFDVNGDGLQDIVESYDASMGFAAQKTFINTGNKSWVETPNYAPLFLFLKNEYRGSMGAMYDQGTRDVDVNGDQRVDMIEGKDFEGQSIYSAKLNTGSGWIDSPAWSPTVAFTGYDNAESARTLDMNGDGLVDLANLNTGKVQLNSGNQFGQVLSQPILPIISYSYPWLQYVDINSDGLTDLLSVYHIYGDNYEKQSYINEGNGSFILKPIWDSPFYFNQGDTSTETGVRFVDINADGLLDVVIEPFYAGFPAYTYLNTGNGWLPSAEWNLPIGRNELASGALNLEDVNGDNLLDFVYMQGEYFAVFINQGTVPDLLKKITYSTGGTTEVSYKATTTLKNQQGQLANPKLPVDLEVVNTIVNEDGFGLQESSSYYYEAGEYFFNDYTDRKFAGFSKISKTDNAGNKTVEYFHQGNTSTEVLGEFSDHPSKIGKPYRTEVQDSPGNRYLTTINKWENVDLGNGRNFVKQTQQIEQSFDGNASHKDKATTFSYDDSNGNLLTKTEWGEVVGTDSGTFSDLGADKYTTSYSYASNLPSNIIGLPSQETKLDQNANKVSESKYYYDNLALGSVNKGNLTKEEKWKTGTSYVDIEKTYNDYGLVTQEKDPRNKTTDYIYDSYNLYPATVTNALSQQTQYLYDYSAGKPKQIIDANNRTFQTIFDGLDRVIEEKQPDALVPFNLVTKTTYSYTPQTVGNQIIQTNYLDSSNSIQLYTYTDGFDRVIQTRKEQEDANSYAVSDTVYNNLGMVEKESLPYNSSGTAKTSSTTNDALWTVYAYDPLYRQTSITNAAGTTTNNYDDWKLTVADPRNKQKNLYKDAYENLVRVEECNSGNTYTTNYEYNGNANLAKITDALGNIRNFTYDGLGRRLTAQDLHAPSDSTFGIWAYIYDDSGNLTKTTDPKNQVVNYVFDDLNRVSTEDYAGQAGVEVTYAYDSGTDGIGRLTSVTSPGANTSYVYNALGQTRQETKTINSTNYVTGYDYDRQGDPTIITNPDNSAVKYVYNTAGQVEQVQRKESTDPAYLDVVTDFDYGPDGKVTYQANSNNTATTNTYDATKLYRLQHKVTTGTGASGSSTITPYNSASGDGSIKYTTSNNWNTTHHSTSGTVVTGTTAKVGTGKANNKYSIERGFVPFDTALIPPDATITDAKLKIYVESKLNNDNDGDDWVTVVQASEPSITVLVSGDYDLAGSIQSPAEGIDQSERKDISNINTGQYLVFNLNSTGRGWIVKGGETKFALREGHDVIDSAFVGCGGQYNQLQFRTSEYSSTASDPILEVTYSTSPASPSVIQDLTYSYDENGNVTQIIDASNTDSAKTSSYVYDDLNRLSSISVTNAANGQNYTQNYTYDAIGNITNKSDVGSYAYAGNQGTNFANPHAATTIGSNTYAYDNNGNLTTISGGTTYSWDYGNRMTQAVSGGVTSTYAYDQSGQRVKYSNGATTTIYPSKYYNLEGTAQNKHIFVGDQMIATIKGTGTNAVAYFDHTDHLTGANAISDPTGGMVELLDYYPFGSARIDWKYGSFNEQRKFTGQEYDPSTGLNYMNARYYNGLNGKFTSQDPVFWDFSQIKTQLPDPQSWNSYAYARNNPLAFMDPDGNMWTPWQSSGSFGNWVGNGAYLHNLFGGNADRISVHVNGIRANGFNSQNVGAIAKETGDITLKTGAVIGGSLAVGAGAGLAVNTLSPTAVSTATTAGASCASGGCQKASTVYSDAVDFMANRGVNASTLPSRSEVISVFDKWANTNLPSKTTSILYHANEHGDGRGLSALTQNGMNVLNSFRSGSSDVARTALSRLANNDIGLKIIMNDKSGGIFSRGGQIVTTWFGK